jgi:hypothetical protein
MPSPPFPKARCGTTPHLDSPLTPAQNAGPARGSGLGTGVAIGLVAVPGTLDAVFEE